MASETAPPPKDPIALAIASIAAGATAGAATMTLGILILRVASMAQTDSQASFLVITVGTLGGAFVAAATPWHLMSSINDAWRRGVTSAIATMLGFVLAAISAPIDMFGGVAGLIAFFALLVAIAVVSYRGALSSVE